MTKKPTEPDAIDDGGVEQELVVEFTQQFTVKPPEGITDPLHAKDWFWNIYSQLGYDVVDTQRKENFEILDVREVSAE